MKSISEKVLILQPVTKKRLCGGWLAVSDRGAIIGMAVVGDTEEEVISNFKSSTRVWAEALSNEKPRIG